MKTITRVRRLFNLYEQHKVIDSISSNAMFWDEPPYFFYTTVLNKSIQNLEKIGYSTNTFNHIGSGFSFFSKVEAISKCLGEVGERTSISSYNTNSIYYFDNLDNIPALTELFPKMKSYKKVGWVKGTNLTTQIETFIPAQAVYLNYPSIPKLKLLTPMISTGTAFSFDKVDAQLKSIYEVIERDATMCMFLTLTKPTRLDISSINDNEIQYLRLLLKKYNLDWFLFDITSDLNIPVVLSFIVDKAGTGSCITAGSRASFDMKKNIIESVSEALMGRAGIRVLFLQSDGKVSLNKIETIEDRLIYWSDRKRIKEIKFITDSELSTYNTKTIKFTSTKQELNHVVRELYKHKYHVYTVDCTLPFLKEDNFAVYKSLIPDLQPLYLDEGQPFIKLDRLQTYYKHKNKNLGLKKINTYPHPFI